MTHNIELTETTVTKHYTSWSRQEPARELATLTVLAEALPGRAPTPLASSTAGTPWLQMTRLPGHPLTPPVTASQLTALGDALEALWSTTPDPLEPINLSALVHRTRNGLTTLTTTRGVIGQAATTWLTLIAPGGAGAHRNPPGTAEAQAYRLLRLAAEQAPGAPRPRGCPAR